MVCILFTYDFEKRESWGWKGAGKGGKRGEKGEKEKIFMERERKRERHRQRHKETQTLQNIGRKKNKKKKKNKKVKNLTFIIFAGVHIYFRTEDIHKDGQT